jgi:hypothetical protein
MESLAQPASRHRHTSECLTECLVDIEKMQEIGAGLVYKRMDDQWRCPLGPNTSFVWKGLLAVWIWMRRLGSGLKPVSRQDLIEYYST